MALTVASSSLGFVASVWRRGRRWREGLGGGFGWRFALMVVAAGSLCTYRLVNEVLYEVFDILRDEAVTVPREAAAGGGE